MIKIFGQTDRDFSSNGDVVLKPSKAKIHKEDNGAFYLDLETGLDYADYLTEGNIVTVDTPNGTQLFRLHNIQKTRRKITSRAYHISYDMQNYVIADSYVVSKTCQDALLQLNNATDVPTPFTFASDVPTIASYRCVRKTLKEAVSEVLERYGGHLYYDGFNIEIRQNIGADNGVTVRYGKNLKDISVSYDWSAVCTKLLPVGKDGILLNAVDGDATIYVYSQMQYPLHYCKTVNFSQDLNEDDYPDHDSYMYALVQDLRTQATNYVTANQYPRVNYTLKANIGTITDVGDTIEVIDSNLGLDLMTNLISYDWDCILNQYTECEFGNFRKTLSDLLPVIDTSVTKAVGISSVSLNDKIDSNVQTINGNIDTLQTDVGSLNTDVTGLQNQAGFQIGDTETIDTMVVGGYLTSGPKDIRFSVFLPKWINNRTITVDVMKLNVRNTAGGYPLTGSFVSGGYDVLNDSTITVNTIIASENCLTFSLVKTSNYIGTNNTPACVTIHSLVLSFS